MSDRVFQVNIAESDLWKKAKPLLGKLDIELTERCNNTGITISFKSPEEKSLIDFFILLNFSLVGE